MDASRFQCSPTSRACECHSKELWMLTISWCARQLLLHSISQQRHLDILGKMDFIIAVEVKCEGRGFSPMINK